MGKHAKKPKAFTLAAFAVIVAFSAGCEGDKKMKEENRCQARCPSCGGQCVYNAAKEKHAHAEFNGNNYHTCGEAVGKHVWDFNGRRIGNWLPE